ncbi:MAG: hypothetical protein M3R01_06765, partial [Actinomycetota bacterium]|nr:hypothetical protein [Actinomycetota bacterium]
AVAVAIAASPLMPVGLARRAEPDLGLSVDGAVLGTGLVAAVVLVTGLALLVAWPTSRSATVADGSRPSGGGRPSVLTRFLTSSGVPPAATMGTRMALEPGRGRTAVPVRSALFGIVTGVVGLVAVIVFAASLSGLLERSERYGFPWDAHLPDFDGSIIDEYGADLTVDPDVRDLGTVTSGLARAGNEDLPVYAFEAVKGSVSPTLLEGRLATRADEVVLGSATFRDLEAEVGGTVEISGPQGPVGLEVVGRAAFPVLDERGAVARGAALTSEGVEPLLPPESISLDVLVTWSEGVDQEAANRELEERTGAQVIPAAVPADVSNLERVEALPRALAAFLAILAVLALAHTLLTAVRRRRRDLAVLRTFGFVRTQVSATVAWQAATSATLGLLVGIPLGVAAGRTAWGLVANGIGVVDAPGAPLLALTLVGLAALAIALLVAARPAREAMRIRPAVVLRTE